MELLNLIDFSVVKNFYPGGAKMKLPDKSPFRKYVTGNDTYVLLDNGKKTKYINFDNAATTPAFKSVLKKINEFTPWYSSIHRGTGFKSQISSREYEKARTVIGEFVGTDSQNYDIIFVKNTTEAINKLAWQLRNYQPEKNIIISSEMEHHSNDLPWRDKYITKYIKTDTKGILNLTDLEAKLLKYENKVKLVTITGASNITGYINPIHKIASLVHHYNSLLMVDGAQLIPHKKTNMNPSKIEKIDFMSFSAHKMYAPFGVGVLITPHKLLNREKPEYSGGGTVKLVTKNKVLWKKTPQKDEAGTPNIMGVIALAEAIKQLTRIGLNNISNYERKLTQYASEKLRNIREIKIYRKLNNQKNIGIIPFNIKGLTHRKTAELLSKKAGIGVRNGCFCAQPYIQKLLNISTKKIHNRIKNPKLSHPGMVRISFGMYNQKNEVNSLIIALKNIIKTHCSK